MSEIDDYGVLILPMRELGWLAVGNPSYTNMLIKAIKDTGKTLAELSVAEALQLCEQTSVLYNRYYG